VRDKSDVLPAIERVGGAPVIIKLLEGTQGIGVILADSVKVAKAIIETLHSTRAERAHPAVRRREQGADIRAFVVGDRVVAAMRRIAQGDEFRSNVHRGGKAERSSSRTEYAEDPCAPRRSWGCGSPAWTCSRARTGPA
jgi:ribosomal protein S6--L-glutamate ligase